MLVFAKVDCMSDSMETPRKPVLTAKGKEKAEKYSKRMELTLNLANLGSTLHNTFTAGNRVLDILDEQPVTKDVTGCESIGFIMMHAVPVGRIILGFVWIFHVLYFIFGIKTLKVETE